MIERFSRWLRRVCEWLHRLIPLVKDVFNLWQNLSNFPKKKNDSVCGNYWCFVLPWMGEFLFWIFQLLCYVFAPQTGTHAHWKASIHGGLCSKEIQIQQLANPHDNAHIFMHYSLLFGVGLEPFASVLGSRRPQAGGIRHTRNVASAHMHKYFCVYSLRDPRIEGMWMWFGNQQPRHRRIIWQSCRQLAKFA